MSGRSVALGFLALLALAIMAVLWAVSKAIDALAGLRIAAVSFTRNSVRLYRILRIESGWRTGHAVAARPARHENSGRWRKAA